MAVVDSKCVRVKTWI